MLERCHRLLRAQKMAALHSDRKIPSLFISALVKIHYNEYRAHKDILNDRIIVKPDHISYHHIHDYCDRTKDELEQNENQTI